MSKKTKVQREGIDNPKSKIAKFERRKEILDRYLDGDSSEQIAIDLGFSESYVDGLIGEVLDKISDFYLKSSSYHTFARYAAFNLRLISQLTSATTDLFAQKTAKATTAAIAAIKAQSDLYDRVLDRGTESGVISLKRPEDPYAEIAGTPDQLRAHLRAQLTELSGLLDNVDTDLVTSSSKKPSRRIREPLRDEQGVVCIAEDWRVKAEDRKDNRDTIIDLQIQYRRLQKVSVENQSTKKQKSNVIEGHVSTKTG
jgi:hypothetical protein